MTLTPAKRSKKTGLESRLSTGGWVPYEIKAARAPVAVAYALGGLESVLWVTMCRQAQGLYSTETERLELDDLQRLCMFALEKQEREERENQKLKAESTQALLVERAKRERKEEERRYLERCAGRPLSSSKRLKSECKVIRPAAVVADKVLAELAAQGPSEDPQAELNTAPGANGASELTAELQTSRATNRRPEDNTTQTELETPLAPMAPATSPP